MNAKILRLILTPVIAVALFTMCSTVSAQGTASGPVTTHTVDPGPVVNIGDPTNPFPIDLDPNGAPWTKNIIDPVGIFIAGGTLDIVENIINVGNEPWFDWHEIILPDATGFIQGSWSSVSLSINGNPIGFTPTGLNSPTLWLDGFSQPVLPGDILEIRKQVDVIPGPALFTMTIQEYPTPEPASAALLGLGSLLLMARRKIAVG